MKSDRKDGLDRLWGRHKSHPLKPRQAALIESLLPLLSIHLPTDETERIEPRAFFGRPVSAVSLEIGFGGGEHLAALAKAAPRDGFIGSEHFLNGIAKMLVQIEAEGLSNIRIFNGDARHLLARLKEASLDSVFLLFPDPWPKKRHHKRRFIQDETLRELARVIRPGGHLRVASDIADYVRWTLIHVAGHRNFLWTAESAADWRARPADWPGTRYEAKAIAAGRGPVYLEFRRLPGGPL